MRNFICLGIVFAKGGHFWWPKITFDRISRHFRSIRNFQFHWNFFTKWPPAAILDDRKSLSIAFFTVSDQYVAFIFFVIVYKMSTGRHFGWPTITFDRISRHFRLIRSFYFFWIFLQNGRQRPFWMAENHFWSHFSPFQINTRLFFFEFIYFFN